MRIIINSDDFGFDEDTTRATIECFERGGLTSATIMANMPCTDRAIEYARSNPQFSFGAHLTFSSDGVEYPISSPQEIPSLVQANGQFLGPLEVRKAAVRNRLKVSELEREIEAQLGLLRDCGIALSHVDSHGHLHKYGPIRRALRKVLPRFGIERVRTVQNIYFRKPLKSPVYWLGWWWRAAIRRSFRTTEFFFMPTTTWDEQWIDRLLSVARDGTMEVGVHPGFTEAWRELEREACIEFAAELRRLGHELIGWSQV